VTADHIPPKLLLARPYPNNLPTVPACRTCNASFQADDEYTRFVISIDVRTAAQRTAQSNMPAILRSLQRPEAGGFARYISNQITDTMVLGADGRPMAQAVEADRGRIHATGGRAASALYPSSHRIKGWRHAFGSCNPTICSYVREFLGPSKQDNRRRIQLRSCVLSSVFPLVLASLRPLLLDCHHR
jgi:hypothetical protein